MAKNMTQEHLMTEDISQDPVMVNDDQTCKSTTHLKEKIKFINTISKCFQSKKQCIATLIVLIILMAQIFPNMNYFKTPSLNVTSLLKHSDFP
jgi:hypothetical protein